MRGEQQLLSAQQQPVQAPQLKAFQPELARRRGSTSSSGGHGQHMHGRTAAFFSSASSVSQSMDSQSLVTDTGAEELLEEGAGEHAGIGSSGEQLAHLQQQLRAAQDMLGIPPVSDQEHLQEGEEAQGLGYDLLQRSGGLYDDSDLLLQADLLQLAGSDIFYPAEYEGQPPFPSAAHHYHEQDAHSSLSYGRGYGEPGAAAEQERQHVVDAAAVAMGSSPSSSSSSSSLKPGLSLRGVKELMEAVYASKVRYDSKRSAAIAAVLPLLPLSSFSAASGGGAGTGAGAGLHPGQRAALAAATASVPPKETLEQHLYSFLRQRYGIRSLIQQQAEKLLLAAEVYTGVDAEVAAFHKALHSTIEEGFWQQQQELLQRAKDTYRLILRQHLSQLAVSTAAKGAGAFLDATAAAGAAGGEGTAAGSSAYYHSAQKGLEAAVEHALQLRLGVGSFQPGRTAGGSSPDNASAGPAGLASGSAAPSSTWLSDWQGYGCSEVEWTALVQRLFPGQQAQLVCSLLKQLATQAAVASAAGLLQPELCQLMLDWDPRPQQLAFLIASLGLAKRTASKQQQGAGGAPCSPSNSPVGSRPARKNSPPRVQQLERLQQQPHHVGSLGADSPLQLPGVDQQQLEKSLASLPPEAAAQLQPRFNPAGIVSWSSLSFVLQAHQLAMHEQRLLPLISAWQSLDPSRTGMLDTNVFLGLLDAVMPGLLFESQGEEGGLAGRRGVGELQAPVLSIPALLQGLDPLAQGKFTFSEAAAVLLQHLPLPAIAQVLPGGSGSGEDEDAAEAHSEKWGTSGSSAASYSSAGEDANTGSGGAAGAGAAESASMVQLHHLRLQEQHMQMQQTQLQQQQELIVQQQELLQHLQQQQQQLQQQQVQQQVQQQHQAYPQALSAYQAGPSAGQPSPSPAASSASSSVAAAASSSAAMSLAATFDQAEVDPHSMRVMAALGAAEELLQQRRGRTIASSTPARGGGGAATTMSRSSSTPAGSRGTLGGGFIGGSGSSSSSLGFAAAAAAVPHLSSSSVSVHSRRSSVSGRPQATPGRLLAQEGQSSSQQQQQGGSVRKAGSRWIISG